MICILFLLALSSLPSTHLSQKVMIATSTKTATFQKLEETSTIQKFSNQSPIVRSHWMESAIIVTAASSCMASALRGCSSNAVQCPRLLTIQIMGYAWTQCCSCAVVISFQQTDTKRQWCQQRSKVQGLRTERVLKALASYCANWLSSAFSSLGAVCVKAKLEVPAIGEGKHTCCHRMECIGSECKIYQRVADMDPSLQALKATLVVLEIGSQSAHGKIEYSQSALIVAWPGLATTACRGSAPIHPGTGGSCCQLNALLDAVINRRSHHLNAGAILSSGQKKIAFKCSTGHVNGTLWPVNH